MDVDAWLVSPHLVYIFAVNKYVYVPEFSISGFEAHTVILT